MKIISFILTLCFSIQSYANNDLDQRLCGNQLNFDNETRQIFVAKKIERDMPPVSDQNPTDWCYAFVASDLINYLNYTTDTNNLNKSSFYTKNKLISPIESSYASTLFTENHAQYTIDNKGILNLSEGGDVNEVLLGYQELNYHSRSLKQVSINSNTDSSIPSQNFIKKLVQKYFNNGNPRSSQYYLIAGVQVPSELYNSPNFKEKLQSFHFINNWLYRSAKYNNLLDSDYSLHAYSQITKQLLGTKDISITPYTINSINTNDLDQFLSKIKSTLYPTKGKGSPLTINLCGNNLSYKGFKQLDSDCKSHVSTIVGAFWKNGRCKIRLRNTWGKNWGPSSDGHINLSIDQLLESHQNYVDFNNTKFKYRTTWISQKKKNISQSIIENFYLFEGNIDYVFTSKFDFTYKEDKGIKYSLRDNQAIAYKFEYKTDHYFTGELNADGSLKSGKLFDQNFQLTDLLKFKWSENQYYTGEAVMQNNNITVKNGTFYDQNNNILGNVKNGALL